MRRPWKLNTLTAAPESAARAVTTTWLGVERSSSIWILMPAFLRWQNKERMSSRLRQCGRLGSALRHWASSA
jgi:hypothetical protein